MREITLTQGKIALVDDEDFDRANQFNWYAQKCGHSWYARRGFWANGRQKWLLLHRFLMPGVSEIDHINGDGLDNRRANLRAATRSQNNANRRKHADGSSGFKGVTRYKIGECWRAQIRISKTQINLGHYESEEDAAHVYDYAAKTYFGEFAKTNFK